MKIRVHCVFLMISLVGPLLANGPADKLVVVAPASAEAQVQAAKELIERRLPTAAKAFALSMIPKANNLDVFEVESVENKIHVRGSSGVALATGWNWYLKHVCQQQMTWCGSNMKLTEKDIKPVPGGQFRQVMLQRAVPYMNYCTLSYSMAWWDWKRWEWETDYMAMNGINMPLALVGIETVWYNALLRVGLSDGEAREFLAGPTYQAWQWMQNIEAAGGPLPKSWIDSHGELGKKIIDRQRSLGMTPVQQGFSGHVPRIFKTKFPDAKILYQGDWCGYPGVAQLDPMDPFFFKFGRIFMEEESKLFGLGGYYAADPFHESQPPKDIKKEDLPKYLNEVGQRIQAIFDSVDPKSIWVMQSWTILKDIACAVPPGRMLIFDLGAYKWKSTQGFWGHNFSSGILHNMGGRIEMHGDLKSIASHSFLKERQEYPDRAFGSGFFMEGIIQNPVVYDLYLDLIWRDQPAKIDEWVNGYVQRRYGVSDGPSMEAWKLMITKGPYRPGSPGRGNGSIVCARPALNVVKSGPVTDLIITYDPSVLLPIWEQLLADQQRCKNFDGYRFDLVDVGRQLLSYYAQEVHQDLRLAFQKKDKLAFERSATRFIQLLEDIDRLCETRGEYRFGDWMESARKWGANETEANLFDKNAAMIVTLWGPEKNPVVNADYSWREWSGLIREFYIPRWKMLHKMLADKLAKGEYYPEEMNSKRSPGDRPSWRENAFFAEMAKWETEWVNTPKTHWKKLDVGSGDELTVASALWTKWSPTIAEDYKNKVIRDKELLETVGKVAFEWKAKELSSELKEFELKTEKFIQSAGTYELEFKYKSGSPVLVESATLYGNGVEIASDVHPGKAASAYKDNFYRWELKTYDKGISYTIKIKARAEKDQNSVGHVLLRKLSLPSVQ